MTQKTSTSSDNVNLISKGDPYAFRLLYTELCHPLIKYANTILKDISFSEDVVQEVFYTLWENRQKLDPRQNIQSYLYTLTRNEALMTLRKKSNQEKYRNRQDVSLMNSPEDIFITNELSAQYNEVLFSLPERCRLIFCMSRFEEKTYQEIADALSISIKTVETQMGRALTILRRILLQHYPNFFSR